MAKIDIKIHPELYRLLDDGETLEEFLRLPPDQILLRWFNYHLKAAKHNRKYVYPLSLYNVNANDKGRELYKGCV